MIILFISFIAGILTVLAPCVLPLLPVILAGTTSEVKNRRRPAIIIGSLSLSIFIFTLLLKGSTALIGASPSFWNYISAMIFIIFGLTLIFPIAWARIVLKIPGHNKPDRWITKGYNGTGDFWTDVVVGAALGPVFTTCSPTFFVILATILPQSLGMGIIDLIAYILGLAISLILISWIGQKLIDRLGWASDSNGWFRKILGIIFIVIAILIAFGLDKKIELKILNSGFFDVTTIEQSLHQELEKPGITDSTNKSSLLNDTFIPGERDEGNYIEIADPAGFINSEPFRLADMIGKKVILIDFIDYSCINCERTFPYLEEWWNTYKNQGFEVIAIHTPEFSFEKDINNVQAAAKQFGLTFPIVLDNNYATWKAYQNEYWPHKYIIDIHGRIVYDKIGEGGDDQVEAEIVKQLNIAKEYLGQTGTVSEATSSNSGYEINAQSPETYFGNMRNEYFGNRNFTVTGDHVYTIPTLLTPNKFYLGGAWHIDQEYAETKSSQSQISYIFTASKAYIILTTDDGKPANAHVLIDGAPVPSINKGSDVTDDGIMNIEAPRLYNFYMNKVTGQHRVDIIFSKPGVRAYTFTFG